MPPQRRQVRKASKARPAKRKRSTGEFSETGYTTPKTSFNPKTGEPTRPFSRSFARGAASKTYWDLPKRARSAAGLQSQLILPSRAIEKTIGRAMRKKTVRKKK